MDLDIALLGAIAVSLSIVAMQLTATLHPPGGATALIAVIGSVKVHSTGFLFVVSPIAAGAIIMLIVGLIVNNLNDDATRHYPKYWW